MAFPFQNSSGGNYGRLGKGNYMQSPKAATYNLSIIIFKEYFIKNTLGHQLSWPCQKKSGLLCYQGQFSHFSMVSVLSSSTASERVPQEVYECVKNNSKQALLDIQGVEISTVMTEAHSSGVFAWIRTLLLNDKSQISTVIHFVPYSHGSHQIVGRCQMVAQHRAKEPVLIKHTVFSTKFLLGASQGL